MSLFHYRAFNAAGEAVSGELEAASLAAVEQRLRGRGVWLRDATERARASGPASGRGVRRGELIAFFVEMSLLLRARITLPTALERMAEDFTGTRMGPVVAGLHADV